MSKHHICSKTNHCECVCILLSHQALILLGDSLDELLLVVETGIEGVDTDPLFSQLLSERPLLSLCLLQ